ncbi:MAG: hypothetical protein ACLTKQ_07125 [Acutalibacteraceae bacterium]
MLNPIVGFLNKERWTLRSTTLTIADTAQCGSATLIVDDGLAQLVTTSLSPVTSLPSGAEEERDGVDV